MKIDVRSLLNELIHSMENDVSRTQSVNSRWFLQLMIYELERLAFLDEENTQHKMIALFMGGIIYALNQDDQECQYPIRLYPAETVANMRRDLSWGMLHGRVNELEYMTAIGEEALRNLPHAFNGELFKRQTRLTDSGPGEAVFPGLKDRADKVDLLMKFCIANSGNLNVPTIDRNHFNSEEYDKAAQKYQMLAEFRQKHKASFHGGWFGSFFSRTNLPAYDNMQTILSHAKKTTFFGFKNRTFQTLREMSVINEQGEVIKPGFN
ncbi:hypothetical protein Lbir_2827 [Legionella birminghamensis]|uniref:Uncharacterized protein n=1 Tax=Legionella birminghamensis TaxID=28083 RepID=A0A378IFS1_9GAMM|nr:hypothetical protein [Legionella birminghamensis]KTC68225.1 hypothetical protein Lbir_2827 [Legionella birminghamensis]STX31064.1 Uncharacterised protein [Legionella birminghamensis]